MAKPRVWLLESLTFGKTGSVHVNVEVFRSADAACQFLRDWPIHEEAIADVVQYGSVTIKFTTFTLKCREVR